MARIERLKMMQKGDLPSGKDELELSLIDMEDHKFKVGEQFDIYNKKSDSVMQAQVEQVLDEMIQIKYINLV